MSLAGVRSNRGDGYQTAIALNWAIRMLHDPSIAWIEVDATSLDPAGQPIVVDDVVIAYRNGSKVYCQCKKNQVDFNAWDLADLRDELVKTGEQLSRDPSGSVQFYSRNNFGDVAKLQEHAQTQPNSTAFTRSLTRRFQTTCTTLEKHWSSALTQSKADVFSFLHRISFQTTSSVNELREQQLGVLRLYVTLAERAYDALLGRLDAVARRQSPTDTARAVAIADRLTRDDVLRLFNDIGAEVTRPRTEVELTQTFRATSAIGRSWRRDIGRKRIPRAKFSELLTLIDAKPRTILITDGPGFGKTCLLLDLIDALEASPTVATLFIQSREFSDCVTDAERVARGLPADLIGVVARMAEYRHTVIIIDSLDVLSLAREHAVLGYFLGFIDRAERIPGVTIVASCRSFDLKYDNRLSQRTWSNAISLGALDWLADVVPLLSEWGVIPETIPAQLASLLTNPRLLAIFEEIVRRGSIPSASTEQELTQHYLEAVVLRDSRLGQAAMDHIEHLSGQMLAQRRLDMPRSRANLPSEIATVLLSEGVLVETERNTVAFGHQTLLDVLAVSRAERSGETLLAFICSQLATPFVRPSIRAFFFHLRLHDPDGFVKQVRATLDADGVAFHIKRLICESLAEIEPRADDWRLVHHLFRNSSALFEALYRGTRSPEWLAFLEAHWLPVIIAEKNGVWVEQHARHISSFRELKPVQTIGFWLAALDLEWVNRERLVSTISLVLHDFKAWDTPGVGALLERLVAAPRQTHDFLGSSLGRWVEATNSGDELLWHYISGAVTPDVVAKFHFDSKLYCGPSQFRDHEFLARRMRQSEVLLDLAINTIEIWSNQRGHGSIGSREWRDGFLRETSYGRIHSRHEHHYVDAEHVLLGAVEAACLAHAAANSSWWRNNELRLRASAEGAMRYFALLAYSKHPEANIDGIKAVLLDRHMLESRFRFEIGKVINAGFVLLDETTQDQIQLAILRLHEPEDGSEEETKPWVTVARRDLIAAIPAFLRSSQAQAYLEEARRHFPDKERQPDIESRGGTVAAPFSYERILELSDQALVRLLHHYEHSGRDEWAREELIGGGDQVSWQLREASSRDPERYLRVLWQHWNEIPDMFRKALLEGPATHLRYRFGNLSSGGQWTPITKPDGATLAVAILTELERHPAFWQGRREAAQSLEACAHVIDGQIDSGRLAFLLVGFVNATDPKPDGETGNDLITTAINSTRGMAAEAGLILANRLVEAGAPLPELLGPTLVRFACDPHPAIPAVLLRRLPVLQYHHPELGWHAFDAALRDKDNKMWEIAESCLYYAYYKCFKLVSPYLDRIEQTVSEGGGAVWGRITALAFLAGHLSFETLLDKLRALKNSEAWSGAASVFAANASGSEQRECCLNGLAHALEESPDPHAVANAMVELFRADSSTAETPSILLQRYFEGLAAGQKEGRLSLYDFQNWLAKRADSAPDAALGAAEIMLRTVAERDLDLWDHEPYTALLTRLFREAEDREESDNGAFLARVIALQDSLLRRGVYQLNEWLKDAERP